MLVFKHVTHQEILLQETTWMTWLSVLINEIL